MIDLPDAFLAAFTVGAVGLIFALGFIVGSRACEHAMGLLVTALRGDRDRLLGENREWRKFYGITGDDPADVPDKPDDKQTQEGIAP